MGGRPDVLDGAECAGGAHLFDHPGYRQEVAPPHHGVEDGAGSMEPFRGNDRDAVAGGPDSVDEGTVFFRGDHPEDADPPHSEPLFEEDTDIVPGSETGPPVGDEVDRIGEFVDDEAEGDDPEEDLDEGDGGNDEAAAPRARSMILSVSRLTSITRAPPKTRSGMRTGGVRVPAERKSIWERRPAGYMRMQSRAGPPGPGSARIAGPDTAPPSPSRAASAHPPLMAAGGARAVHASGPGRRGRIPLRSSARLRRGCRGPPRPRSASRRPARRASPRPS